jgi:hypothetical protein
MHAAADKGSRGLGTNIPGNPERMLELIAHHGEPHEIRVKCLYIASNPIQIKGVSEAFIDIE